MALIATVSFSKKIPVPDSEYSSQGYSLSLQTEIPESDPAAIQARLSETFQLVRNQVEQELANGNGVRKQSDTEHVPTQPPVYRKGGNAEKVSNKQVKYILDLAKNHGLSLAEINERVGSEFGASSVYDLDRKSATGLIDNLKAAA